MLHELTLLGHKWAWNLFSISCLFCGCWKYFCEYMKCVSIHKVKCIELIIWACYSWVMELNFGLDISFENREDWKRTGEYDEGSFGIINGCYTAILITRNATSIHISQEIRTWARNSHSSWLRGFPPSPLRPYFSHDTSFPMEISDHVHAPAALSLEKETLLPFGENAGWTPEPLWTLWGKENPCPIRGYNEDRWPADMILEGVSWDRSRRWLRGDTKNGIMLGKEDVMCVAIIARNPLPGYD